MMMQINIEISAKVKILKMFQNIQKKKYRKINIRLLKIEYTDCFFG